MLYCVIHENGLKELKAEYGYKILLSNGVLVDSAFIPKDKNENDYSFVEDATYIPPIIEPEIPTLSELQENQIKLSKRNLSEYLEEHPLLSYAHKSDGGYYKITSEKQQQLTSKLLVAEVYKKLEQPYELTWNESTEPCEVWSYEELVQLSMEIDAYVTPLVRIQQYMEVDIRKAQNESEVLMVNVEFTEENIQKYLNI